MNVQIKIFPIAGLCDQAQKLELALEDGGMGELLRSLQDQLGVNLSENETIMFLHNGRALDRREETVFHDGDQLWLMPQISGG